MMALLHMFIAHSLITDIESQKLRLFLTQTFLWFALKRKTQVLRLILSCKLLSKYSLCGSNSVQTRNDGSEVGRVKLSPLKVNQSWTLGSQMEEHS